MKPLMILAAVALAASLTSCGVADGLVKSASRTTGVLSRTVSNIGNSVSR